MNCTTKKFIMAICQLRVIADKNANLKRAEEMINAAVSLYNPNIVVLPEFFNTPLDKGTVPEYAEEESDSISLQVLSKIAKTHNIHLIGGSIPIKEDNKYYNSCYCFDNEGQIKARHRKLHLFDIDIPGKMTYKESETISAGNDFTVFDTGYCKIGIGICYDIRFPEYAQLLKKDYDIDMLVYPAAFNTTTGPMHWELLQRMRAVDNNVWLAMASPARNYEKSDSYQCYGFSSIIDPFGTIVNSTKYEEDIVIANIDLTLNETMRTQIPTWSQKRNDLYEIRKKI